MQTLEGQEAPVFVPVVLLWNQASFFFFQKQGLTMQPNLSLNLLSVRIMGTYHHIHFSLEN
jgi:hypothetical protein